MHGSNAHPGYIDDEVPAADTHSEEQLVAAACLRPTRAELDAIHAEIDAFIAALRHRLERGFE